MNEQKKVLLWQAGNVMLTGLLMLNAVAYTKEVLEEVGKVR